MALTAASPMYRGYLSDIDTRWTVIAQSVDCRTEEERGLKVLSTHSFCTSIVDWIIFESAKYLVFVVNRLIHAI